MRSAHDSTFEVGVKGAVKERKKKRCCFRRHHSTTTHTRHSAHSRVDNLEHVDVECGASEWSIPADVHT